MQSWGAQGQFTWEWIHGQCRCSAHVVGGQLLRCLIGWSRQPKLISESSQWRDKYHNWSMKFILKSPLESVHANEGRVHPKYISGCWFPTNLVEVCMVNHSIFLVFGNLLEGWTPSGGANAALLEWQHCTLCLGIPTFWSNCRAFQEVCLWFIYRNRYSLFGIAFMWGIVGTFSWFAKFHVTKKNHLNHDLKGDSKEHLQCYVATLHSYAWGYGWKDCVGIGSCFPACHFKAIGGGKFHGKTWETGHHSRSNGPFFSGKNGTSKMRVLPLGVTPQNFLKEWLIMLGRIYEKLWKSVSIWQRAKPLSLHFLGMIIQLSCRICQMTRSDSVRDVQDDAKVN